MEAKWIKITESTEIYGGEFIRQVAAGDVFQFKILGPDVIKGFLKIMLLSKNGVLYPTEKMRITTVSGFVLMERFEIYDEGLSPSSEWPQTLEEAIGNLKKELGEPTVSEIGKMSKIDFELKFGFYGLGLYIRNQFGLWRGNRELLQNVDPNNPEPDNVSAIILDAFYANIHSGEME